MMNYRNPIFTENGWIACEINHPEYGWIPFTCNPDDTGASFDTTALFEEMKPYAASYIPPSAPTDEDVASQIRAERNRLLSASDWTQVADAPIDQGAWATYRQALRDIPSQEVFPHSVVWPVKP